MIYAGVFLASGKNNNKTIDMFKELFVLNKDVNVFNITSGENLVLLGLKKDGQLLEREADIVKEQSRVPIDDLYLLKDYLSTTQKNKLKNLNLDEKKSFLKKLSVSPKIAPEAKKAIKTADIIIYGPGTQHSSLLPSYMTSGVAESIEQNKIAKKVLIINIMEDHDIQDLNAHDIFDNVLKYLGSDNKNFKHITHALYTKTSSDKGIKLRNDELLPEYRNANWISDSFERHSEAGIHMGSKLVESIFNISKNTQKDSNPTIDMMINPHKRTKAIPEIVNELKDLNWNSKLSGITLHVQSTCENIDKMPPNIKIIVHDPETIETESFKMWMKNKESSFFVAITGDGVYRMRDVLNTTIFLQESQFVAMLGSRNQDKKQMLSSVNYAYGRSKLWYFLGNLASYINTSLYMMKYQKVFSDPLTGFRVYKKSAFENADKLLNRKKISQFAITAFLLKKDMNISELPVFYRTYTGFTDRSWRIKTALKNTLSILFGR